MEIVEGTGTPTGTAAAPEEPEEEEKEEEVVVVGIMRKGEGEEQTILLVEVEEKGGRTAAHENGRSGVVHLLLNTNTVLKTFKNILHLT